MGSVVKKGTKYCLRCDVMYAPVDKSAPIINLPRAYHPLPSKSERQYISYLTILSEAKEQKAAKSEETKTDNLKTGKPSIEKPGQSTDQGSCNGVLLSKTAVTSAATTQDGQSKQTTSCSKMQNAEFHC
jgi:hypothetical protein